MLPNQGTFGRVKASVQPPNSPRARSSRSRAAAKTSKIPLLDKCPSGIRGFDQVTAGGLPRGRPTLICGGPGCGKTVFSLEFLIRGIVDHGEPGVFVSFEESPEDLRKNVASLGLDLDALIEDKRLAVDHVRVERSEIEETGEYDLDGLFIRLGYAIDSVGARRIVLDTIESLFSGLSNTAILRAELRRLFVWLKERGVTAVITGERGEGALTRQGLEEYVSDCVVLLDHRAVEGITTRRLRIVKYRGSTHGTNEYPFLIEAGGITVMPITAAGLVYAASDERVSSGVARLDEMLGGRGYYRGSSILISGTAGSGKSSLAAHFARAVASAKERCLYFAFEEAESQILRNMRSIGVDLGPALAGGWLAFHNARPSLCGLEMHLATMHKAVEELQPSAVIIDPISNFTEAGALREVRSMLVRLIDFLKGRQITGLFTSLTAGDAGPETTEIGISSLMDSWLLLRNLETNGERNRGLYVLKSRGMSHSNQIREFVLTDHGIELHDVYTGPHGVLTGSARIAQEAREQAEEAERQSELARREHQFERKRAAIEAQISALRHELSSEQADLERSRDADATRRAAQSALRGHLADARGTREKAGKSPQVRTRKRNGRGEVET